jgi:hypothetical protein
LKISESVNRTTKDNQIKTLQDEMAQQDDIIAKLSRDKKGMDEDHKRTLEHLQKEEDKVNHLTDNTMAKRKRAKRTNN